MKLKNSAQRLYWVLSELDTYPGKSIKDTLTLFASDNYPITPYTAYLVYIDIRKLIDEVTKDLKKVKDVEDIYLLTIEHIDEAWEMDQLTMEHQFTQIMRKCASDVEKLQFCSDLLHRSGKDDAAIEEDKLSEILQEITDLSNDVSEADISLELKEVVLQHSEAIRQAILLYKLKGPEGLKEAVGNSVGALLVNSDAVKDDTDKQYVKKMFSVLGDINILFNLAEVAVKLEPLLQHLLTTIH